MLQRERTFKMSYGVKLTEVMNETVRVRLIYGHSITVHVQIEHLHFTSHYLQLHCLICQLPCTSEGLRQSNFSPNKKRKLGNRAQHSPPSRLPNLKSGNQLELVLP